MHINLVSVIIDAANESDPKLDFIIHFHPNLKGWGSLI
jgi:hypothetical protein